MSSQNDKQLITKAKQDISNFKALYQKYVSDIYRYCYYRLYKNQDIAEDITSETFVKAIEKFDTYEYANKPFVVWLYAIAHNLIVDHYRSKKEGNISLDSLVIPPADETEEILDTMTKDDIKAQIQESITKLPHDLQNIFTLKHVEDLTFAQIGKLLGKSEGAIKMQYYRGLDALKALISAKKP